MKGIIINEGSPLLENKYVNACYIKNGHLQVQMTFGEAISYDLSGEKSKSTAACCNKDDTYDFETGALIALMKMCGLEKSAKAYAEIFDDTAYGDALIERDKLKNKLQETTDCLNDLSKRYDDIVKYCDTLRESNKGLQEEIKRLKGESENHWKKYQRNIQKKQDRINELEAQVKASEDDKQKNIEYYEKEIKNLKNIDELFESEQHTKSELGRLSFEKHRLEEEKEKLKDEIRLKNDAINEWKQAHRRQNDKIGDLVCENYKLKTDCEMLQHGYNDMIFCGGRQNGKQYTFLVDLFKKIDQKKVDAAYKEAYNTTLPVWQKEVLKQMYDIHKESKEKIELPRTLDINGTVYRKSIQVKDFGVQIKPLRPLTKREEMWGKILGDHKYGESLEVKVEKAFIDDFLSEAEDNGLVWANGGEKPTEWNRWEDWRTHDYIVFTIWYRGKTKELTWEYPSDEKTINYLPPMRWDLFEKGRLAIKVTRDNYKEFYEACEKELGRRPISGMFTGDYFTVSICKKDGHFEVFTVEHQKETGKKIVDWEDVRDKANTTEDPYDTWKW